jgi:hypothetical protein
MNIAKIEIEKAEKGYRVSYHIQDSKTVMGEPEPVNAFEVVCSVTAQIVEWEEQKKIKECKTE